MEREYEWDENKNRLNQAKHGIDFYDAVHIFLDSKRIQRLDNRKDYKEERYQTIGLAYNRLITVIFTIRNGKYRLISARRANKNERKTYYN